MSEIILRTKDLTKKYGSRTVVDNLNIEIRRGEIIGLLGPNGAGKSTTMNMICSIVRPTAGSVELLGKNPWKQKKDVIHKLGYIPQELAIYGKRSLFYLLASGPFGATGHFFCFFGKSGCQKPLDAEVFRVVLSTALFKTLNKSDAFRLILLILSFSK